MTPIDMPGETMDFGALAARLAANIEDVRACLLMSRDGLTLGVYPREEESMARDVWDRLRSIGNPDRGFLVVGDELWIVARRGPYAGIAVASASATPGLLLDRLEFTLRAAEELRVRDGSAPTPARAEATRRPRTPLHPEAVPEMAKDRADPAAVEDDLAWVADPVELLPMVDLSAVNGGGKTEPGPRATSDEEDASLDPVRAAIQFASMTGAVGAIPTMPKPEAATPPAIPEAPPADVESDAPPAAPETQAPPAAEAPPAVEAPPEVQAPPEIEAPSTLTEIIAEPLPPPAEPPPPTPFSPDPPPPEAKPSRRSGPKEEEAEVDPVDLAREFAQLVNDMDEGAR